MLSDAIFFEQIKSTIVCSYMRTSFLLSRRRPLVQPPLEVLHDLCEDGRVRGQVGPVGAVVPAVVRAGPGVGGIRTAICMSHVPPMTDVDMHLPSGLFLSSLTRRTGFDSLERWRRFSSQAWGWSNSEEYFTLPLKS